MMNEQPPAEQNLTVGRNLKIGFFHLGSGMADVMATGVWNRVMISDLGFAATPIGLLVSLRYFLAPLGIFAGRISDRRAVLGYQRLFWVWLGRFMMVLSVFMLGYQTAAFINGSPADLWAWIIISLAMLLFSLGSALSSSTFLALIYDRSNAKQRGRSVGIVWTFLLLGFTIGGIAFGLMLPSDVKVGIDYLLTGMNTPNFFDVGPDFSADALLNLFLMGGMMMGSLWFFSLLGEEKRQRAGLISNAATTQAETSLMKDLGLVLKSRPMRYFGIYLAVSMMFAFSQDLILEPFAGDVFDMSARTTTKFAAYWGSMAILGTIAFLFLARRFKWLTNYRMNTIGVTILIITFALFAMSSLFSIRWIVTPALITLGLGLGIWNVGTLGMMMDMSPLGKAGTFLGFWTLLVTFARGFGVSGGAIARDVALSATGSVNLAYGIAFGLGVLGLSASLYALNQINAPVPDEQPVSAEAVFAGAMD
ncbi:MAG: BCD family MFS transporter [Anaerolineae bacterium]|nr:BCD family MFS transporter [Anaerolineae bacterium]